jgi:hypothetical protein
MKTIRGLNKQCAAILRFLLNPTHACNDNRGIKEKDQVQLSSFPREEGVKTFCNKVWFILHLANNMHVLYRICANNTNYFKRKKYSKECKIDKKTLQGKNHLRDINFSGINIYCTEYYSNCLADTDKF